MELIKWTNTLLMILYRTSGAFATWLLFSRGASLAATLVLESFTNCLLLNHWEFISNIFQWQQHVPNANNRGHTQLMPWELPCIYLARGLSCWQGRSESSITKETKVTQSLRESAGAGINLINLAQLWLLTEDADVREMGKQRLIGFNVCLCTVWRYLILIVTELLLQRRGLLAEENVSCFQNIRSSVSQSTGDKYSSAAIRRLYQQRPREMLNQPIYQPVALKAFSSHPVPIRVSDPKCFPGGQRGEKCHGQFDFNKWESMEWDQVWDCCHNFAVSYWERFGINPV